MKFSIYTLGCKVNQYESQAMEQALSARGWEEGRFDEPCDLYIINSCSVTAIGDKKSRNAIRRARRLSPGAALAVCGCSAQLHPEEFEKIGADIIGGSGQREEFLRRVEEYFRSREKSCVIDKPFSRSSFEVLPAGSLEGRTRAIIKAEDGCRNFCSYCIIPYARGAVLSLPVEEAVRQIRTLRAEGYRETVVSGIELSSWGQDLTPPGRLETLLTAVLEEAGEMRIRLGSLEPRTIDAEFCAAVAPFENLCPQFHLSLQSGSDTVLRRMNRKYDTDRFRESAALLRKTFEDPAITTDLIVGFPGETEKEFQESLNFLREIGFAQVHVFPYSRRSGTAAAKMPGQLTTAQKARRSEEAGKVAAALRDRYRRRQIGKTVPVLFEQTDKTGRFTGHSPNYIPVATTGENLHGQLRNVLLTGIEGEVMTGELR